MEKAERQGSDGATRDHAQWAQEPPGPSELLTFAAKRSGRGVVALAREMWRLRRGPGRLRLNEYVQFGLYDDTRFSAAQKAAFLSNREHWKITQVCCDMTWQATTEDKWLTGHILAPTPIALPETLGMIDKGFRSYPGTRVFRTLDDLRTYLVQEAAFPLFGKVNRGMVSFGAFQALGADDAGVDLKGEGRVAWPVFWDRFLGSNAYILQKVVRNHSFFDRFCKAVATVRLVVLVGRDGVSIPVAVLKIPAQANIADAFWRPGNLACGLDPATGTIVTAKTKSPLETVDHETHPETGARLPGEVLPHWDAVLAMARDCAAIFAPLRYQSMDVAITDRGPVLIEINTGGGFDLPQLATGQGMLTPEIRGFFEGCGYKFG